MKTILVDAGNERLKLNVLHADQGFDLCGSDYDNDHTQEFFNDLSDYEQPVRIIVSSVRGSYFQRQLLTLTEHWEIPAYFLSIQDIPGFRTLYKQPPTLGIDRCLALVGATARYSLPLMVVDAGTVVTVDLVDKDGIHTGGMFFPGLNILRKGMAAGADLLSEAPCKNEMEGKGITTQECLCSGTLTGWVSALSGIIDTMDPDEATIVVCGGDGEKYLAVSGRGYQSDPHLVFEGMKVVHEIMMTK